MHGVTRFDASGVLGKVQRTPQGGIRVAATLTRVGNLRYQNPDGSSRIEHRPADEVFRADSLATLRDAPVTNLHHGLISPANYRKASVGNLSGEARQDGKFVAANLVIQDERTIGLIDSGERCEVSMGYTCRLDHTPGKTAEGERYDAVQRDIQYNHVALVPRGRAGREVALRLDSDENQIRPEGQGNESTMKIEIIGGVEYEVGTSAHRKASSEREDSEREDSAKASTLEGENVALKAELAKIKTRLDAAPASLAKAVQVRVDLLAKAAKARAEVREDMSDEDIRRAVIGKVLPAIDLTDKDPAFVAGVFEVALTQAGSSSASNIREDATRARQGADLDDREDADTRAPDAVARDNMIARTRKAATTRHTLDKS